MDLMTTLGMALLYPSQYKAFSELAADALKKHLVKATVTDFNGKGDFTDLKPGDYWIFCFTKTRGGFAIWNLPVKIKPGRNYTVIDDKNAAQAF
jgi:hypothetical protein